MPRRISTLRSLPPTLSMVSSSHYAMTARLDQPSPCEKDLLRHRFQNAGSLQRGVSADTLQPTKGSMKMLLAKMPPVIEWASPSHSVYSSSNGNMALPEDGSAHRTKYAPERLSRGVEAHPLLAQSDSLAEGYASNGLFGKSSYVTRTRRTRPFAASILSIQASAVRPSATGAHCRCSCKVHSRCCIKWASNDIRCCRKAFLLVLWKKSLADVVGNCQAR